MSDASRPEPGAHAHHPNGRDNPIAARILRRWRELSGGRSTRDPDRRTLVACSGGADSVALSAALASVPGSCVLAHIRHDFRPDQETKADLEFVESLGDQLGLEVVHQRISVAQQQGNLEENARNARYAALGVLADSCGCRYIATGHHADDQFETLLMHLMRGSGTRGMAGMQPTRVLGTHSLLRPMLSISRAEIESMLTALKLEWRDDETNKDTRFVRNRIRKELLPEMRLICPEIAKKASEWARDLSGMQSQIDQLVEHTLMARCRREQNGWVWARSELREQSELMLGYLPGRFCQDELAGVDADRVTRRSIESWVRAVKSDSTDPTTHRIGPIVSEVRATRVTLAHAHDELD